MTTQTTNQNPATQNVETPKQEFSIQRLYVKKISFDAPTAPQIFRAEWKPNVEFKIETKHEVIEENIHQVILIASATAKLDDKIAFIAEVHQAGIFTMRGFDAEQIKVIQNTLCPNTLFPYAREEISRAVANGGFPSFYLAPMNFDAIYAQYLQQQEKERVNAKEAAVASV